MELAVMIPGGSGPGGRSLESWGSWACDVLILWSKTRSGLDGAFVGRAVSRHTIGGDVEMDDPDRVANGNAQPGSFFEILARQGTHKFFART